LALLHRWSPSSEASALWHSAQFNGSRLGFPPYALFQSISALRPGNDTQNYKNKMSLIKTQKQTSDTVESLKRHIRRLEDMNWKLKQELRKWLYAAIHAKRKRIEAGSGEKMRKVGSKGAPTAKAFKQSAKTAKKK
jgi:hypothetical protein